MIGIDFGACSLRAVQLQKAGSQWKIHHWVNIESEPTDAQPAPRDYAGEIRMAFGPGTFSGRQTALVLSPPDVEYKLLEVPGPVLDKPPAELKAALQFELDRQMPWPAAESEVAAWPVQPGASSSANAMVVSARSASVRQFLDVLDTQQLDCVRADLVPNALIHVCTPAQSDTPGTGVPMWGIMDIGFRSCRLYLVHQGRLVYARVLRGAGRELTEVLTRALHVEFRIAEQYKRIYGIQKTDRGFRSLVGGVGRISEEALPSVLYAILRPTLEAMANEVERSYRFALGRLPGVSMGPVYLAGGGARMKGLQEVIADRLGLPVCLPEAKTILGTDSAGVAHPACSTTNFPVLAACVGLAVQEAAA